MSKLTKVMAALLVAMALLGFTAGPAAALQVKAEACWSNSCSGGGGDVSL